MIFFRMHDLETLQLREPEDYFQGRGSMEGLTAPRNVLLFTRRDRNRLQQEALQNRSHHRWVLILNLETAGQVHVDHRTHPLHPGQALLVRPFQFHHYTHLESSTLLWLFCTFELDPNPLLDPLRRQPVTLGENALMLRKRLVKIWTLTETDHASDPALEPLLQATLLPLLLELRLLARSEQNPVPFSEKNRLVEHINCMLDDQKFRNASIADLASELNLSGSGLRAKFQKTAGVPLGAYLRNYRINRAMELLRTTDLPIAEIAGEAGFSSPQAFSRAFREAIGSAPRAYRV